MTEHRPKRPREGRNSTVNCDFCRRDLTSQIRIRCADCCDLDLCLECFSTGMEIAPHKKSHSYRIISQCKIPLFDTEWGADEEAALLEALEICGVGNWSDISDYVQTKTKQECETHYHQIYLNSTTAPLPCIDLTDINNPYNPNNNNSNSHKKEEEGIGKKEAIELGKISDGKTMEEQQGNTNDAMDIVNNINVKKEDYNNNMNTIPISSDSTIPAVISSSAASAPVSTDELKTRRDTKLKKTKSSIPAAPSSLNATNPLSSSSSSSSSSISTRPPKLIRGLGHLVGYIPARNDFDTEFDNEAELMLADMEFKDEDTKWERELKLKVLDIYNSKLDARLERKKFILERGLLERKEKKRSKEEREIYNSMRVFARFHSAEQHEQWVQGLLNEQRLRKRIEQLQQYRLNGIKTLADGELFEQEKKKRDALNSHKKKNNANNNIDNTSTITGGNTPSLGGGIGGGLNKRRPTNDDPLKKNIKMETELAPFDLSSMEGNELLSAQERYLCEVLRLTPLHFFSLKERLVREAVARGFVKDPNSATTLKIDINKNDKTFDCFVAQGWLSTQDAFHVPNIPTPPSIPPPTLNTATPTNAETVSNNNNNNNNNTNNNNHINNNLSNIIPLPASTISSSSTTITIGPTTISVNPVS